MGVNDFYQLIIAQQCIFFENLKHKTQMNHSPDLLFKFGFLRNFGQGQLRNRSTLA